MEVIKVDVHCLASRNDDPVNAMQVIWVVTRVPGTFQFIIRHIPAFCKNTIINVKQSFNNASLGQHVSHMEQVYTICLELVCQSIFLDKSFTVHLT